MSKSISSYEKSLNKYQKDLGLNKGNENPIITTQTAQQDLATKLAQVQEQNANLETQLAEAGISEKDIEKVNDNRNIIQKFFNLKENTGLIMGTLELMNRPAEALQGALAAGNTGEDVFSAAYKGLSGQKEYSLKDLGIEIENPLVSGFANIAFEMAADPFNFVDLPWKAIGQGAKNIAKKALDKIDWIASKTQARQDLWNNIKDLATKSVDGFKNAFGTWNAKENKAFVDKNANVHAIVNNEITEAANINLKLHNELGKLTDDVIKNFDKFNNAEKRAINNLFELGPDFERNLNSLDIVEKTKARDLLQNNMSKYLGRQIESNMTHGESLFSVYNKAAEGQNIFEFASKSIDEVKTGAYYQNIKDAMEWALKDKGITSFNIDDYIKIDKISATKKSIAGDLVDATGTRITNKAQWEQGHAISLTPEGQEVFSELMSKIGKEKLINKSLKGANIDKHQKILTDFITKNEVLINTNDVDSVKAYNEIKESLKNVFGRDLEVVKIKQPNGWYKFTFAPNKQSYDYVMQLDQQLKNIDYLQSETRKKLKRYNTLLDEKRAIEEALSNVTGAFYSFLHSDGFDFSYLVRENLQDAQLKLANKVVESFKEQAVEPFSEVFIQRAADDFIRITEPFKPDLVNFKTGQLGFKELAETYKYQKDINTKFGEFKLRFTKSHLEGNKLFIPLDIKFASLTKPQRINVVAYMLQRGVLELSDLTNAGIKTFNDFFKMDLDDVLKLSNKPNLSVSLSQTDEGFLNIAEWINGKTGIILGDADIANSINMGLTSILNGSLVKDDAITALLNNFNTETMVKLLGKNKDLINENTAQILDLIDLSKKRLKEIDLKIADEYKKYDIEQLNALQETLETGTYSPKTTTEVGKVLDEIKRTNPTRTNEVLEELVGKVADEANTINDKIINLENDLDKITSQLIDEMDDFARINFDFEDYRLSDYKLEELQSFADGCFLYRNRSGHLIFSQKKPVGIPNDGIVVLSNATKRKLIAKEYLLRDLDDATFTSNNIREQLAEAQLALEMNRNPDLKYTREGILKLKEQELSRWNNAINNELLSNIKPNFKNKAFQDLVSKQQDAVKTISKEFDILSNKYQQIWTQRQNIINTIKQADNVIFSNQALQSIDDSISSLEKTISKQKTEINNIRATNKEIPEVRNQLNDYLNKTLSFEKVPQVSFDNLNTLGNLSPYDFDRFENYASKAFSALTDDVKKIIPDNDLFELENAITGKYNFDDVAQREVVKIVENIYNTLLKGNINRPSGVDIAFMNWANEISSQIKNVHKLDINTINGKIILNDTIHISKNYDPNLTNGVQIVYEGTPNYSIKENSYAIEQANNYWKSQIEDINSSIKNNLIELDELKQNRELMYNSLPNENLEKTLSKLNVDLDNYVSKVKFKQVQVAKAKKSLEKAISSGDKTLIIEKQNILKKHQDNLAHYQELVAKTRKEIKDAKDNAIVLEKSRNAYMKAFDKLEEQMHIYEEASLKKWNELQKQKQKLQGLKKQNVNETAPIEVEDIFTKMEDNLDNPHFATSDPLSEADILFKNKQYIEPRNKDLAILQKLLNPDALIPSISDDIASLMKGLPEMITNNLNRLAGVQMSIHGSIARLFERLFGVKMSNWDVQGYMRHMLSPEQATLAAINKVVDGYSASAGNEIFGRNLQKIGIHREYQGAAVNINKAFGTELFNTNPVEATAIALELLPQSFALSGVLKNLFDTGVLKEVKLANDLNTEIIDSIVVDAEKQIKKLTKSGKQLTSHQRKILDEYETILKNVTEYKLILKQQEDLMSPHITRGKLNKEVKEKISKLREDKDILLDKKRTLEKEVADIDKEALKNIDDQLKDIDNEIQQLKKQYEVKATPDDVKKINEAYQARLADLADNLSKYSAKHYAMQDGWLKNQDGFGPEYTWVTKDIINKMKTEFEYVSRAAGETIMDTSWMQQFEDMLSGIEVGRRFAIHKGVFSQIKRFSAASKSSSIKQIWNAIQKYITIPWKKLSLFSVGFHVRNISTNYINAALAGINVRDFHKGFVEARHSRKIFDDILKTIDAKLLEGTYKTAEEQINLIRTIKDSKPEWKVVWDDYFDMLTKGIIGNNQFNQEALNTLNLIKNSAKGVGPKTGIKDFNKTFNWIYSKTQKWFEASLKWSKNFDDWAKIAIYKELKNNKKYAKLLEDAGMNAEQYTKFVLFDYNNLTYAEETYMKALFPFYTWARKNVEFQLKNLPRNTKYYMRFYNALQGWRNGVVGDDENEPDYMQQYIPIWNDGEDITYIKITTPWEAADDILNGTGIVNALTPIIKTPLEMITGYDFFTGRNFNTNGVLPGFGLGLNNIINSTNNAIKMLFTNYSPTYDEKKTAGVIGNTMYKVANILGIGTGLLGLKESNTDENYDLLGTLLPSVFSKSNINKAKYYNAKERQKQLQDAVKFYQAQNKNSKGY